MSREFTTSAAVHHVAARMLTNSRLGIAMTPDEQFDVARLLRAAGNGVEAMEEALEIDNAPVALPAASNVIQFPVRWGAGR